MANSARIAEWVPVDVESLEPAAEDVVRSTDNKLVIAGPGAGKTELLAQRACFLLQTGVCAEPRRILAISLKRDAARNLRERVARRCGHELASRFDSYTFDSFAKGLVDRFLMAIPKPFRPSADYRVLDGSQLNDRKILDLVRSILSSGTTLSIAEREGLNVERLWNEFAGRPLPLDGIWENETNEKIAAADLWTNLIHGKEPAHIGFPMIGRIAELILRANPLILGALRNSYRYVFLDEFQDTTGIYYGLLRQAFLDSESVLTAVGDNKQRIMIWAGAMRRAFDQFCTDFNATKVYLTRNHRSAQSLVEIQSVIAKKLDPSASEAVSMDDGRNGPGECRIFHFDDEESEAKRLAQMIRDWIDAEELAPREVCVLCRMKPPVYTQKLRDALDSVGVRSGIENELQDLLAEPLVECVLDLLKIACRTSSPESWGRTVALLGDLVGDDSDLGMRRIVDRLLEYLPTLGQRLATNSTTEDEILEIVSSVMSFVGTDPYKAAHPQYAQGEWYGKVLAGLTKVLSEARAEYDWSDAIDEVEGVDSVPIMTTHKSKGLEYHTVIFVGLEDAAHWNFEKNADEEMCGFFVAFSRAKRRVLFTFSGIRPTGRFGKSVAQKRATLAPLYELLSDAGIEIEKKS